jgi:hypothetical protein
MWQENGGAMAWQSAPYLLAAAVQARCPDGYDKNAEWTFVKARRLVCMLA